jgi:hypothetical protein
MIRALARLRRDSGEEGQLAVLRRLEAEGQPDLREDARLALARALLQRGEAEASLELYRRTKKTGRNRLEVLGSSPMRNSAPASTRTASARPWACKAPTFSSASRRMYI